MRILYISSAVPPFQDSAAIRSVFLLRGFARRGAQVTTVSPDYPNGDASLLERMPSPVRAVRTSSPHFHRMRQRLTGRAWWLYANMLQAAAVPDILAGWEKDALAAAEPVIASTRPDVLFSSSGSPTGHMAAGKLARQHRIPWIADVTDPWGLTSSRAFFLPFWRWRNRRLERATLSHASALLFTTEECMAAYQQAWGSTLPDPHYVPCGYDNDEFAEERRVLRDGPINLTYVGVAYGTNRNLNPAMEGVARWNRTAGSARVRMQVVGPHSEKFERLAQELSAGEITFSGHVPYERSLELIRGAHVLFLIGNDGVLQIPGKVYMYLASGRPILYVGQLPKDADPTYKLLREFPGVAFAEQDAGSVMERLRELDEQYENWERLAQQRRRMPQLERFEWDRLAGETLAIAKKIIR